MTRLTRGLLTFLLILGVGLGATAQSANEPAVDRSAPIKTMVPHRNAVAFQSSPAAASKQTRTLRGSFSGPPYKVGPTKTLTTTVPEAEEHIAVDPNNFKNVIGMISDFSLNGGFNTSKFSVSKNNGGSWKEGFVPLSGGMPATGDGQVWQANSDPVVAIDKLGNVYLANLYIAVSGGNITNDGYYVCVAKLSSGPKFKRSGCRPVKSETSQSTLLEDKEWIAADNSTSKLSGNVYASWTHFVDNTTSMILFSRSVDHGVHWSKPIQINPAAQNGAIQGSQVAVGSKGEVYVSYEVFFTGNQGQHMIAKSTNGGVSFGTPAAQTPLFNNLTFCVDYRCNSFPALAVNPKTGFIYDVYTDQPGANSTAEFVRSTTAGGLTFTAPVKVNDSSKGQRLMPAVAADSNGVVHMSWFDTRRSPTNPDLLDIFATFTRNNGSSFAPNARANAKQITASSGDFIGDYSGNGAGPNGKTGLAHPVWTSGGLNENGKMQSSTLTVP
jgi:hypothetical protein